MHRTNKYSQHSSIIYSKSWPVWLNGWVFVYELSGSGFESSCSHFVSWSVFGEVQLMQISLYFKTFYCNLKIRGLGAKLCVTFLLFSFWKEIKLKVKLWWVGACKRKTREFFVPFILSEGNSFNICVLSQCIVYWIRFQNIHTFTHRKTLLPTLFCLFLKSSKAFSVYLRKVELWQVSSL